MPYAGFISERVPQTPKVGRPKRDRTKTKAARRANRARRR